MKYLLFFLASTSLLVMSCSSEEEPQMMITEPEPEPEIVKPDVIGVYTLFSARDECPDPAFNVTNQGSDGQVCASSGCATVTFILRADSTYNYDQLFEFSDGTEDEYIEDGTFTFRNNTVVTTSLDRTVIDQYAVVSEGEFLDFLNFVDNNNCEQFWRFSK